MESHYTPTKSQDPNDSSRIDREFLKKRIEIVQESAGKIKRRREKRNKVKSSARDFPWDGGLTASEMGESEAAGGGGVEAESGAGSEPDGGGGGGGGPEGGELEGVGGRHRGDPHHRPGNQLFGSRWVALGSRFAFLAAACGARIPRLPSSIRAVT